ncbi:MAG: asparagine synthase (glutamine-hydrolyzing) [Deltaproteobacteria bacterium RIFOXYA12_FULL_61_11]|nr:MAG: asparagine synthase (glutamine-hydrolyzing) [Deltaproteobacteria bacterium RIFOXYA12_FULL_61_11]
MCGICGFLCPPGHLAGEAMAELILAMADRLHHRGPDAGGSFVRPDLGVALGHRRLSILDLTPTGGQPMTSVCGRYVLVLNGEIYNFRELRAELEREEAVFRGSSDTEVVLAAFTRWGIEASIPRLEGMFAFAVLDLRDHLLVLARDRLGEKPLAYGRVGTSLAYASELVAMQVLPGWSGRLDRGALGLYCQYNYLPEPLAIYEGLHKLPAGTWLALPTDRPFPLPEPRAYWSAKDLAARASREPSATSAAEADERLLGLLRTAVRRQMISDVPLGAFLSSGIDSPLVVALMQEQSSRPVKTFTIGLDDPERNEAPRARRIAEHLRTEHHEEYLTADTLPAMLPELPGLFDEPFADPSQLPTLLVARFARRHVTVALSGDAGDELFGGYLHYQHILTRWATLRLVRNLPDLFRTPLLTLLSVAMLLERSVDLISGLPKLGSLSSLRRLGERGDNLRRLLLDPSLDCYYQRQLVHPGGSGLSAAPSSADPLFDAPSRWLPSGIDELLRLCHLDLLHYLPGDILTKVDRTAMSVSLETRIPLLDPAVVDFALRLPSRLKLGAGVGKLPLRRLLGRYLPPELLSQRKQGFGIPLGAWLRGPLRSWADDLLAPSSLHQQTFLDPVSVTRLWHEHRSGQESWEWPLFAALVFLEWAGKNRVS